MVFCSLVPTVVRVAQGEARRKLLVARKPSDEKWKQELKELEKQTAKTGKRLNRMFFLDVN